MTAHFRPPPVMAGFGPWAQTASGRAVDLVSPQAWMIHFGDIAQHLSRVNRFCGATDLPYSVAQHSVIGTKWLINRGLLPEARYFLLHDAHEAYIGDLPTPMQAALCVHAERASEGMGALMGEALKRLKSALDGAIFQAAGLAPMPLTIRECIEAVDLQMLRAERNHLMAPPPMPWDQEIETTPPLPMRGTIKPMRPGDAELEFRTLMRRLFPDISAKVQA